MNYLTHQLLNAEEINLIKKDLEKECSLRLGRWQKNCWKVTPLKVKNNLQLNRNSDLSKKFSQLIKKKILSSQLIKSFALPKRIHGIMFTKSFK